MSLPCLLGMHDIIWHNTGSSSFHLRNHVGNSDKTRMNSARPNNSSRQNIDAFTRSIGPKNHSSNNLDFLLRSNEGENFVSRTPQDSFHSGKWSVSDGSQQEVGCMSSSKHWLQTFCSIKYTALVRFNCSTIPFYQVYGLGFAFKLTMPAALWKVALCR